MTYALKLFDHQKLRSFLNEIGVKTHVPDGFRVFPTTHDSSTIIDALTKEMKRVHIEIQTSQKAEEIMIENGQVTGVKTENSNFTSKNIILATGGLGYPSLGAEGDGHKMVENIGHRITKLYPAMMPLITKERWQKECRKDTIAKATIKIDLKKARKLKAVGDLIFTKDGIRGPVVLDFAREITPLLDIYGEVPLLVNMTKGMN
jgi:predicted Rossmann fold flavoprotein